MNLLVEVDAVVCRSLIPFRLQDLLRQRVLPRAKCMQAREG